MDRVRVQALAVRGPGGPGEEGHDRPAHGARGGTPEEELTPDQLLALQLYARGYTAEQIGRAVGQSTAGVGTLLSLVARRLGVPDAVRAVREARRRGLIM